MKKTTSPITTTTSSSKSRRVAAAGECGGTKTALIILLTVALLGIQFIFFTKWINYFSSPSSSNPEPIIIYREKNCSCDCNNSNNSTQSNNGDGGGTDQTTTITTAATTSIRRTNQETQTPTNNNHNDQNRSESNLRSYSSSSSSSSSISNNRIAANEPAQPVLQLPRYLFGIFSYDNGKKESDQRIGIRASYLSYFKDHLKEATTPGTEHTICSLKEWFTLPHIRPHCRIVYTFVMGGGNPETRPYKCYWGDGTNCYLTGSSSNSTSRGSITSSNVTNVTSTRRRVLLRYERQRTRRGRRKLNMMAANQNKDADIDYYMKHDKLENFVLPNNYPEINISEGLQKEIEKYDDFTFLSVRENQNDGKTETWYTYATALLYSSIDENYDNSYPIIRTVGKLDSDTILFGHRLLQQWEPKYNIQRLQYGSPTTISSSAHDENDGKPYVIGGWYVPRQKCATASFGRVCDNPHFVAPYMLPGGFQWFSLPILTDALLDPQTIEKRLSLFWPTQEDMSITNVVFGMMNITYNSADKSDSTRNIQYAQHGLNSPASHFFKTVPKLLGNYFQRCNCYFNVTSVVNKFGIDIFNNGEIFHELLKGKVFSKQEIPNLKQELNRSRSTNLAS